MTRNDEVSGFRYTLTFEQADPDAVALLGGKGAGLARMTQQGLRVPPGYITSTDACREYLAAGAMPEDLPGEVFAQLAALERRSGKTFGGGEQPLLLSVRSGAPVSMPGMMDTILNLGLGRSAAIALARACDDTRFMADSLARFHRMYAETVLGALDPPSRVDELVAQVTRDADPGEVYDRIWAACQELVLDDVGKAVPDDPREQLIGAVGAVFASWNTRRARTYRDFHKIPHDLGTAVVVQSMVFGNLSADSGSGVVFTRNPVSGEPELFGEFLRASQGEDVVAGTRTPDTIAQAAGALPAVFDELRVAAAELERRHGDVLDIEFTVERSTLYFLQVRSAKRTAEAAVRIAADFHREGVLDTAGALAAVTCEQVRQVQRPGFDADELAAARRDDRLLTTGIGASPGQVSGVLVLDPDRAQRMAADGARVILARQITSPADLHGMIAADGIVTATGGSTSHAAVVARALGKTCVVGCSEIEIDPDGKVLVVGQRQVREGEEVSLDGTTGELFAGAFTQSAPAESNPALQALLGVAGQAAGCTVLSRVTLPQQVPAARTAGATGLVTAVDDVLAASGYLGELVDGLLRGRDLGAGTMREIEDTVARQFTPLLAAAGDAEIGVRAMDFLSDESRELIQQTALLTRYPELSVPLGVPALIEAQLRGLARAAHDAGNAAPLHLAVRHISDPREAAALRALHSRLDLPRPVGVAAYLTSPRGALLAGEIAAHSDTVWVEVRLLQASVFGLPARQLLTQQPMDEYLRRKLLDLDPRSELDPTVDRMLGTVAQAATDNPDCRLGMRLSGPVSEDMAAALYRHGVRRFAVDADETRPLTLALGKAELSAQD